MLTKPPPFFEVGEKEQITKLLGSFCDKEYRIYCEGITIGNFPINRRTKAIELLNKRIPIFHPTLSAISHVSVSL